jgi:hypothetical protein
VASIAVCTDNVSKILIFHAIFAKKSQVISARFVLGIAETVRVRVGCLLHFKASSLYVHFLDESSKISVFFL